MISFWATFRDIWRFFSGHTGDEQPDRPHSETCLESCHACAAEFWANPSLFIVSFRAFLIPISNIISIMQIEKKRRWFAWDSNPGLQMHRRMELWWPPMCSWIYFWFVTTLQFDTWPIHHTLSLKSSMATSVCLMLCLLFGATFGKFGLLFYSNSCQTALFQRIGQGCSNARVRSYDNSCLHILSAKQFLLRCVDTQM